MKAKMNKLNKEKFHTRRKERKKKKLIDNNNTKATHYTR